MAETYDAPHVRDLLEQGVVRVDLLRPAGEMDTRGRVLARLTDETLPEMLGEERHHGRDHAQRLDERVPEDAERVLVLLPEPAARAADVPVREVVDIAVEGADHVDGEPPFVSGGRVPHELPGAGDEPAVERAERDVRTALQVREARLEPRDVRVLDEERGRVPERQELPLDLVRGAEAEQEVPVGRLRAELPAHHVGAHPRERIRGIDRVPPRAVHLATLLVEHLLVAEHLAERRRARERDGHEELRVEPEPDLLAHLRDPVGREPLLPVGVVGQVGAG